MDHGRIATEPGHPVRTVAAHLWNRCAGDLLYEAAQETPCFAFFLCAVVTGVVEYIIGVVGIHLFGMRLWDYRGLLLNLDGIICLRSVMSFALMGLQGEFCRYFSGEDPDPQRDLLTVGSASLVMSDEEMIDFLTAYGELIQKYMPNKPGEGRKVRKVTVVVSPNE